MASDDNQKRPSLTNSNRLAKTGNHRKRRTMSTRTRQQHPADTTDGLRHQTVFREAQRRETMLVEQSSKPLKALRGIGILFIFAAVGVTAFTMSSESDAVYDAGNWIAGGLGGLGIGTYVVAMVATWWNHG